MVFRIHLATGSVRGGAADTWEVEDVPLYEDLSQEIVRAYLLILAFWVWGASNRAEVGEVVGI